MRLSMSSRRERGKRGIRRDFDWSLWPGGGAFELSCCPGGRDFWIFVCARDHKSFPGVRNFSYFDLTFLSGGREFYSHFFEMSKSHPMPRLSPYRLDIDRCIKLEGNLWCYVRAYEDVRGIMTHKTCAVTMRNAILRNHLRWPKTRALANAIQGAHNICNNKHGVDKAIILFAQCLRCLIFLHNSNRALMVLVL